MRDFAVAQFTSASTAAVASISLGFKPDFAIFIQDHGGTNPNVRLWANNAKFDEWAAALALLVTGSTGAITRDTASLTVYDGGDVVTSTDVTNKKYWKPSGDLYAAGDTTGAGITVPAGDQTNSGANLLIAFRADR